MFKKNFLHETAGASRPWIRPESFVRDLRRGSRENHTQEKYYPVAMNLSLVTRSRSKPPMPRPQTVVTIAAPCRPGAFAINRSHVKHKPAAHGRGRPL